ncbi:hypothetical protein WJX72_000010 [[Myrmecia] bisecta]|uniref:Uncharacterized protein n=1 Tax=[Myrmecia] bisecta TaxID=41462 RepID=A0AAW1QDW4_9CHLO
MASKTRPDLSGYWQQIKNEGLDQFLKELGYPWVVRKMAHKYGSKSTDIVKQKGAVLKITTVNAKASWTRVLHEGKTVSQADAEGIMCKTTSWWDGDVHKSRLEGASHGATESWRYMEGGLMVVKTTLHLDKGRQVSVLWYLEAIAPPHKRGSVSGHAPLRTISRDQKRVQRATAQDTTYLRQLARKKSVWETPADTYIGVGASEHDYKDSHFLSHGASSPRSAASRSPPSHSPLVSSPLAQDAEKRAPAAFPVSAPGSAADLTAVASQGSEGDQRGAESKGTVEVQDVATSTSPEARQSEAGSTRPKEPAGGRPQSVGSAYEGDAAEKSPLSGSSRLRHVSGPGSTDGLEGSLASGSRTRAVPESLEAQLSYKLQEYAENRSITSVVPVENPLTTHEPELLEMSPEQAEETQLKLRELEREIGRVTLGRQRYTAGWECLFCTCVCHRWVIPPYLRTWDL